MNNLFEQTQGVKPRKNKFDLSHETKLTLSMGRLVPILCQEVIPGDRFRVSSQVFLRFLALIAPVMHRIDVTVHYFFVPNRLMWSAWQDFITGGESGLLAPAVPTFNIGNVNTISPTYLRTGSLLDYLGFPVCNTAQTPDSSRFGDNFSLLPARAYQLIYDQYYRDQNLQVTTINANFLSSGVAIGADTAMFLSLKNRAWQKDYLTSALPFTQRGNAVSVPQTAVTYRKPALLRNATTDALIPSATLTTNASSELVGAAQTSYIDNISALGSFTVNALRLSVKLQQWLETNALGGARYIEQIFAHFGVISSDARLQRVEYLGGGRNPVVVSEVLSTAPPTPTSSLPIATLAGSALAMGSSNQFSKFFEEHGIIMGILSVMPTTSYQNNMEKKWLRTVNSDYFFPEFANLGEQTITNQEGYYNPATVGLVPNGTWGYQSRYAEYKYAPGKVHSQFRESLGYWHLGRQFAAQNVLNSAFITSDPRGDIFAVPANPDNIVCQIYHSIDALRPMPYFGTPEM